MTSSAAVASARPAPGLEGHGAGAARPAHALWVRVSHWLLAAGVLTLMVSGFVILMAHPRLYWGAAGNDLTPALIELPVSRNYRHGGWDSKSSFGPQAGAAVSAVRTYDIFNQNAWARSLHFLAAWVLVATAAAYLVSGIAGGHLRRDLLPRSGELAPHRIREDTARHLRAQPPAPPGPPYGIVQKVAYCGVVFLALPAMVITGLTMSPGVTAAYPGLLDFFGGVQSARTIHFCFFAALVLFVLVHVAMVVRSGWVRQLRAMTTGD